MQRGAGQPTGLSARRARRTKSRGLYLQQLLSNADQSRPRQTVADQSILRSAVLPASPMPLFKTTCIFFWEIEEIQRTDGMRKAERYLHIYKYNFQKNCCYLHIHKFHSHQKEDIVRGDSAITAKVKPLLHKTPC